MLFARLRPAALLRHNIRSIASLSSNPHIKVLPHPSIPAAHLLTYLGTEPPDAELSIGITTAVPPTPASFRENPGFLPILESVLAAHAGEDADLQSQARAFAGPGGTTFGGGAAVTSAAGGASAQGGAGGGGVGGWVHLSDSRNPPDFGRIAWPEDILGSVEVNSHGEIIGDFEPSGTYRIVTNEGILGLSDFLRTKLVERLKEEERVLKK